MGMDGGVGLVMLDNSLLLLGYFFTDISKVRAFTEVIVRHPVFISNFKTEKFAKIHELKMNNNIVFTVTNLKFF